MSTRLVRERDEIRHLLSASDPADALTAYYALHHPPGLTRLHLHRDAAGAVDGFLAVCTTGADLFRPLVVLRAASDSTLQALVREALVAGRPYHLVVPLRCASTLEAELQLTERLTGRILALDPARFEPIINVLVVRAQGASGGLRFEIRSHGRVMAAAGTNWCSPQFAEIYVYSEPEARGRGWAKSVASACVAGLLAERVRPLYVVAEGDEVSAGLAADLGFEDTRQREFTAVGVPKA